MVVLNRGSYAIEFPGPGAPLRPGESREIADEDLEEWCERPSMRRMFQSGDLALTGADGPSVALRDDMAAEVVSPDPGRMRARRA